MRNLEDVDPVSRGGMPWDWNRGEVGRSYCGIHGSGDEMMRIGESVYEIVHANELRSAYVVQRNHAVQSVYWKTVLYMYGILPLRRHTGNYFHSCTESATSSAYWTVRPVLGW